MASSSHVVACEVEVALCHRVLGCLLQATGEGVKRGAASGGEVAIEDVRRNEL